MSAGLNSLFSHVGDDKLKFQFLSRCTTKINTKKHETELTFATEHENVTADSAQKNTGKKMGIVVWMDIADFESWKNSQD